MTNKDKYLKDGVDTEDLTQKILDYNQKAKSGTFYENMRSFWSSNVKPTLTEDERVILRNLPKDYETIGKCVNGVLYVTTDRKIYLDKAFGGFFNHLFQFIKDGEEYEIAELLKGE